MLSLIPHLILWPAILALVVVVGHELTCAMRRHGGRIVLRQSDRERLGDLYRCLAVAARHKLGFADTLVHCAADGGPGWYVRDLARAAVQLGEGRSFAQAAASAPSVFSAADRAVLEAAEREGRLGECFEALSLPRPVSRSLVVPVLLITVEIFACLFTNWWMVYGCLESVMSPPPADYWAPDRHEAFLSSWNGILTDYETALAFALVAGIGAWLLVRARHVEAYQRYFFATSRILQRSYWLPVLRQLAYSAGAALRAGISGPAAVRAAIAGSDNPLLAGRQEEIVACLERGQTVAEAFSVLSTLPSPFVSRLRVMKGGTENSDAWLTLAGDNGGRGRRILDSWALVLVVLIYPIWGILASGFSNPYRGGEDSGAAIAVAICSVWLISLFALSVMVLMMAIFHTRE